MSGQQLAIVGAGPYGLAAAAYLRAAGIVPHVFGRVMAFWKQNMPRGLVLRSAWEASHIGDPGGLLTLDRFQRVRGMRFAAPVPLASFIAYGEWFQQQVVADLDQRRVTRVELAVNGFRLQLEDGDSLQVRRVVIAAGLAPFANRPAPFADVPPSLVSHASDHHDLRQFANRRVLVIGGGQSALESAALLHEAGADVEVVVRAAKIHWLRGDRLRKKLGPLRPLLYPPTDVGPPGLSLIVGQPEIFRRLPLALQHPIARRCIRPAGAAWLRPRLAGIAFTAGRVVVSAGPVGLQVQLMLDDGSERRVDHVLLGTGYRVRVVDYPFLSPEIKRSIRCSQGYPELAAGFESSVPGLHFLGAPAAGSFGPLLRFVAGTTYAGRTLRRYLADTAPAPLSGRGAWSRLPEGT